MTNIEQTAALLRSRTVTCVDLTTQALHHASALNPQLNAFITITADAALECARQLDVELAAGHDRGPLHGIPVAHKDIIFTKGVRTTSGSKLFADFVPDYDATVVRQLDAAGTVSIGKLGLHEIAYGISSSNPHFGPVRNPWNTDCIPGGSSGGSGAAVAAGIVFMATGTDTGGSIRIPATYCGTVGFKPTYGLVSRHGVRPLGFSLDHIGPLTRTVRDAELAMQAISQMRDKPVDPIIKVGLPENYYFDKIDPEVRASVEHSARLLESATAHLVPVRVPDIDALNAASLTILLAEAAAAFQNYLSRRDQFGPDVMALLDQGQLVSGIEYVNAQRIRKQFVDEFRTLFTGIDILVTPTSPIPAPKIGQLTMEMGGETVNTRLVTTRFMRAINALGLPALSLPCGLSSSGLPIGIQLIGRPYEDALVLHVGRRLEQALHQNLIPPVSVHA